MFIAIHVLKVVKDSRVVTSSMKFFQAKTHMAKTFFFSAPVSYSMDYVLCCTWICCGSILPKKQKKRVENECDPRILLC